MEPSSTKLGSSMRGRVQFFLFGLCGNLQAQSSGVPWEAKLNSFCSASNFWCQKLKVEQKKLRSALHGIPKLHAWGIHERLKVLKKRFSHSLGAHKHVECKMFYAWPPTFEIWMPKVRGRTQIFLHQSLLKLPNLELEKFKRG
jgi:hypothetical protein